MKMKRYVVSLKLAAEYGPNSTNGVMPYGSSTHEEFIVTDNVNVTNGLEEVTNLIAKLLANQGTMVLTGRGVHTAVSFRKYVEATVYPAGEDKESMLDLTLTRLRQSAG